MKNDKYTDDFVNGFYNKVQKIQILLGIYPKRGENTFAYL